jgi:hypothetical protein
MGRIAFGALEGVIFFLSIDFFCWLQPNREARLARPVFGISQIRKFA